MKSGFGGMKYTSVYNQVFGWFGWILNLWTEGSPLKIEGQDQLI
jgi:hypothetical protein